MNAPCLIRPRAAFGLRRWQRSCRLALPLLLLLTGAHSLRAEISEPDNILYGTIVLDNTPVTAARTDVVIEARRTTNGPAIASYRMGSRSELGNFYSLRLRLESLTPLTSTNASQIGHSVFILVRDASGVRGQTTFTFNDRGHIQRVDFGAPVIDGDADGLPDLWEVTYLGGTGAGANDDSDLDGQSAWAEYQAGTDPMDSNDVFRVEIQRNTGQTMVWFQTRRAEGPGYDGMKRYYSLESTTGLGSSPWNPVAGITGIEGTNQIVTHTPTGPAPLVLYRAKVSLASGIPDSNGLPDAWEIATFGAPGQDPNADPDMDGKTTAEEFVSGSHPMNPDDVFRVTIEHSGNQAIVSFLARQASGPGYEGLTRLYTLETKSNLASGSWAPVPGFLDIIGSGQTVNWQAPSTNSIIHFRARTRLQ